MTHHPAKPTPDPKKPIIAAPISPVSPPPPPKGFWPELLDELKPLIVHVTSVALVEVSLAVVGGLVKLLEAIVPKHADEYNWFELIDIWIGICLLALFGVGVLLRVAIIIFKSILQLLRHHVND